MNFVFAATGGSETASYGAARKDERRLKFPPIP